MNNIIIFLKSFDKIIDMLKSCCLDMIIFSDLSNKLLIKCANFC